MTEKDAINFAEKQLKITDKSSAMYDFLQTSIKSLSSEHEKSNTNHRKTQEERNMVEASVSLMQEITDAFINWYAWQHGDDAMENLNKGDRFGFAKSYYTIVGKLFFLDESGVEDVNEKVREKCKQLKLDWGEIIEFE